jgi:hypothetical protein
MSKTTAKITLKGLMDDLIPRSKYPLAPLYEAITNSLEAISQKSKNEGIPQEETIEVKLYFTGLIQEVNELDKIEVSDNGTGFNDENLGRFETLLDKSKGYNNRGSGRIQYLHRAEKIEVNSFYKKDGKFYKRHFVCDSTNYITSLTNEIAPDNSTSGTILTMTGFNYTSDEKSYFDTLEIKTLKNEIKNKFLLRLYLDKEKGNASVPKIKITFIKLGKKISSEEIISDDIPAPLQSGNFSVPYVRLNDPKSDDIEWSIIPEKAETFQWAHFKLPQNELEQNGVFLCSKNVPVEGVPLKQIKKGENVDGYRFLTAVYGDVLDHEAYVSHSVDSFKFPHQKETEKQAKEDLFFAPESEFLFYENIEKEIESVINSVYGEVSDLKKRQEKNVIAIAKAHGISEETALSASFNLTDTEQQITDKIYAKQAQSLSKDNQKIKKLYESLNDLNPTDENYQEDLEKRSAELLELIPQSNKEELGRYIIRREMITKVLKLILENALTSQIDTGKEKKRKDKEGLIHDLIFKRKNKTTGALNDLWILNEEYVHFEGCSEIAINQIEIPNVGKLLQDIPAAILAEYNLKPARRPDIFLYPDEGKCILIELKEPETNLADHLGQLTKYANLIANFSTFKIERFYCYLIGENLSQIDVPGDFEKTVNDDWVRGTPLPIRSIKKGKEEQLIAKAYIEIIKLSSIHSRAHRRNKSFADKLGIRVDDVN